MVVKALLIGLLLLSLYSFSSYYNTTPLSSYGYPLVWFLFDADLYLKVIFSSSLFCTLQLMMSSLQNKLLGSFSLPNVTEHSLSQPAAIPAQLPKRLHKSVLYAWLTSNPLTADASQMFSALENSSSSNTSLEITQRLYQLSNLLSKSNQSSISTGSLFRKLESEALSEVSRYATLSSNVHSSAALDYLLLSPQRDLATPPYFNECSYWSLDSIQRELGTSPETLKTLEGLFYSTNFSYSKLNNLSSSLSEMGNLRYSVEDQLSTIRWQRWLYKYNILHRASLKNTMYLTSAKKLLSSGFYDSSLLTNNIWASSTLGTSAQTQDMVQSLTQAIYGDFSRVNSTLNTHMAPNSGFYNSALLGSLGFYELSYHWFIQRFYQLNTLNSNGVVSLPSLRSPTASLLSGNIYQYESSKLNLSLGISESLTYGGSILDSTPLSNYAGSTVASFSDSDVYLQYGDYTTFSKQKVEIIRNLTSNSTSSSLTSYSPSRIL